MYLTAFVNMGQSKRQPPPEVGLAETVRPKVGRTQSILSQGWVDAGGTSGGGYIFYNSTLTSDSESTWGYPYTLTYNPRRWVASVSNPHVSATEREAEITFLDKNHVFLIFIGTRIF